MVTEGIKKETVKELVRYIVLKGSIGNEWVK